MKYFSPHMGIMKRINNILGSFRISGGLAVPNTSDDTYSIQSVIVDNIRQACMTISGSVLKPGGILVKPNGNSPSIMFDGTTVTISNVFGVTQSGDIINFVGPKTKSAITPTSPMHIGVKYTESVVTGVTNKAVDGSQITPVIDSVVDLSTQFIQASTFGPTLQDLHTLYLGYLTLISGSWVYTAHEGTLVEVLISDLDSRVTAIEEQQPTESNLLQSNAVITGAAANRISGTPFVGRVCGTIVRTWDNTAKKITFTALTGTTPNGGQVCIGIGQFGKPPLLYEVALASTNTYIAVKTIGSNYTCTTADFIQASTLAALPLTSGDYMYIGAIQISNGTFTPPTYDIYI